jgi:hypothetical protein
MAARQAGRPAAQPLALNTRGSVVNMPAQPPT